MSDFTMEIVLVTPEMARNWLEHNHSNRNMSKAKAKQYAKDIKAGNWQLSPEGVSFDKDGNIKNGQHRLEGIVLAGVPVKMAVFRGVEATIFDRGRPRTANNTLAMNGFPASVANSRVTGAINFLFSEVVGNRSTRLSDAQIQQFCEENEDALSAVRTIVRSGSSHGNNLTDNSICCAAVFCALYSGISKRVLSRFFEIVNKGYYDFFEETAAITLRNYLVGLKGQDYAHYIPKAHEVFSQVLSAINGFVARKPREKKYPTLETPYYFPRVRDYIKNNFID